MANSTAFVHIKPTVAFNRGDTFVFGAWVCTADGAGSFQRRLIMQPDTRTGLVTLPEVVTGELAGKFGEISLSNIHADFELESVSNSNPTSPWAIACEPAAQPSQAAPSPRRAGKEPASEYNSDSDAVPNRASDSSPLAEFYSNPDYEFDFGSDP
jgi:hypothetical protein